MAGLLVFSPLVRVYYWQFLLGIACFSHSLISDQADARRRAVELGVIEAIIKSMTACANDALVSHGFHTAQKVFIEASFGPRARGMMPCELPSAMFAYRFVRTGAAQYHVWFTGNRTTPRYMQIL